MPRRDYLLATLFLLGTLLVHWPSHNAGFVSDFLGWQSLYEKGSWTSIFNSFGYGGHQQVLQLINYTMYRVFGTAGLPWYILFCTFHAAVGFLLYRFILKITALWEVKDGVWAAVFGALFFLFSPYHPEVTVWRVCLHYMISAMCSLGALLATIDYLERGRTRSLYLAHGLMLVNLFTLELALAIPLLTHAICIAWWVMLPTNAHLRTRPFPFVKLLQHMTLPQIGLYAFFFVFNKLTLGQWVGHYGEARMLKFDALRVMGNPLKYVVKPLVFARHFDHPVKMRLFDFLSEPKGLWMGYGLLAILVLAAFLLRKRVSPKFPLIVTLLVMSILAAVPVANLHLEWVLYNENDRYGYLPALFVLPALALVFSAIPRWFKYLPAFTFLLLSAWLMYKTTVWWGEMERIYRKLLDEFHWYDKREIYVLSLADNYQGIWMFRDYSKESALADALRWVKNKQLDAEVHELAFFNMNTPADGVTATKPDSTGMIRVEFDQWGNWWWLAGLGASDYETDRYKIVFKGKWYELTLKGDRGDAVFIYQSGDSWKVLE